MLRECEGSIEMLDALEFAMADLENADTSLLIVRNSLETNEEKALIDRVLEKIHRSEGMLQALWEHRRYA